MNYTHNITSNGEITLLTQYADYIWAGGMLLSLGIILTIALKA